MQNLFDYSPEVKQALQENKPVLALESTLITHGLPYPHNFDIAVAVEKIARDLDVTPATIAILNGKVKIGLTSAELEELVHDKHAIKASCRDMSYAMAKQLTAGTTVAATMYCAHRAGIKLFATGGIGGVHRGDDQDISADLIELGRTPVAVICSGAKSILDLPKTLEYLETNSVPVVGYQTDKLPAFYTRSTSHQLTTHVDNIDTLAQLLKNHWQIGMPSGIVIANPIPAADEIPAATIDPVIELAIQRAQEKQILGKAITPFLLNEVAQVTQGKSLQANIQLIKNNVELGAKLARLIYL